MKKQYITPSIVVKGFDIHAILHTLSGGTPHTAANNEYAGYTGNDIGVDNEKMTGSDYDDFLWGQAQP